jgi:hypothetical protein
MLFQIKIINLNWVNLATRLFFQVDPQVGLIITP